MDADAGQKKKAKPKAKGSQPGAFTEEVSTRPRRVLGLGSGRSWLSGSGRSHRGRSAPSRGISPHSRDTSHVFCPGNRNYPSVDPSRAGVSRVDPDFDGSGPGARTSFPPRSVAVFGIMIRITGSFLPFAGLYPSLGAGLCFSAPLHLLRPCPPSNGQGALATKACHLSCRSVIPALMPALPGLLSDPIPSQLAR